MKFLLCSRVEDPDSSEILFPAEVKDSVDWETVNKMTLNPDVRDLLKRIKVDIASKEIRREMYDPVLTKDDLVKTITRKRG